MTDLTAYGPLADRLASLGQDERFQFDPAMFPDDLPETTPISDFVIRRPWRILSGQAGHKWPFELIQEYFGFDGFAEAETYRRLGLWLMHLVFSGRDFAGLALTHPDSNVSEFWVGVEHNDTMQGWLRTERPRVLSYEFWPQTPARHAFLDERSDEVRPLFGFGYTDPQRRAAPDPALADQVIMQVTPEGLAEMAALLMSFGMPWSEQDEVNLEPPHVGFGSARPHSIKARFWLPATIAFYADSLEGMDFSGMVGDTG